MTVTQFLVDEAGAMQKARKQGNGGVIRQRDSGEQEEKGRKGSVRFSTAKQLKKFIPIRPFGSKHK